MSSLAERLHAEHKARRDRLGYNPAYSIYAPPPAPEPEPIVVKPEPEPEPEPVLPAPMQRITIKCVVGTVADFYGIPLMDMVSVRRPKKVAHARQVACYLARTLTPCSLPQIGRAIGGRDHTTVLQSVRKIKLWLSMDSLLAGQIDHLVQKILARCNIPQEMAEQFVNFGDRKEQAA